MFSCQFCSREYTNKNSLTRHSHNHRKTREHACLVCGTIFWRKDLLSRHTKMHEEEHSTVSGPSLGRSRSPEPRKRCHTACDECRASRVKCNGENPCSTCENTGKHCIYASSRSSRISQGPIITRTAAHDQENIQRPRKRPRFSNDTSRHDVSDNQNDQALGNLSQGTNDLPRKLQFMELDAMQADFSAETSGWPSSDVTSDPVVSTLGELDMSTIGFDWNEPMNAMTAWPSLHEDMFFFDGADLAWPKSNLSWPLGLSPSEMIDPNIFSSFNDTQLETELNGTLDPVQVSMADTVPELGQRSNPFASNPPSGYLTPDPADQDSSELPVSRASSQLRLIGELVDHSVKLEVFVESRNSREAQWRAASTRVSQAFVIQNDDGVHILQHFVDLYLQHFAPLWPLLATHNFDSNSIHPALYLTLTSIGAMYSGRREGHYATMLHERIRKALLSTELDLDESEHDLLWLGQARLLTQVAALYFGQKRAFSCSQYLGGILVSQARRMNLFLAQKHQRFCLKEGNNGQSAEDRLACWIQFEARKRLVFGILRAESYTSVLLNTRPLVSAEEINLELPCSDDIWRQRFPTAKDYLEAIRLDQSTEIAMFSDLVRITFDRNEQLPSLEPFGYELLLFGLQNHVWRYSHDPDLFKRLTGKDFAASEFTDQMRTFRDPDESLPKSHTVAETDHLSLEVSQNFTPDHLAIPFRKMASLFHDCDRLFSSLQNWKQSFDTGRTSLHLQKSRTSLLSSLLLYETTFLRLYAPIENLHLISYQIAGKRPTPDSIIVDVLQWTQSSMAEKAVQHACKLWNLIELESKRMAGSPRAQFNFIAFAGLHHAAVVLWAYASNHSKDDNDFAGMVFGRSNTAEGIRICRGNRERLLGAFVRIYKSVSPSRWSSFAMAAINLSKAEFPVVEKR